jgi:hypothetical protein
VPLRIYQFRRAKLLASAVLKVQAALCRRGVSESRYNSCPCPRCCSLSALQAGGISLVTCGVDPVPHLHEPTKQFSERAVDTAACTHRRCAHPAHTAAVTPGPGMTTASPTRAACRAPLAQYSGSPRRTRAAPLEARQLEYADSFFMPTRVIKAGHMINAFVRTGHAQHPERRLLRPPLSRADHQPPPCTERF